jgi:hypothetical protein
MIKHFLFALVLSSTVSVLIPTLFSQSPPQAINYQAVARDAGGNLITTPLTVRISIRSGSASGPVVYQETHNATPNTYGLFNLSIGQGTPGTGSFGAIDWSAGTYFAQVELNTGSGFQNMGTQQMLSVPYALYAGKAGTVNLSLNDLTDVNTAGVTAGQVLKWDGSQWTPANDVGGGAGDNWGTQVVQTTARLTGDGTSGNPLDLAQQGATNGQVLKWNGTTWAPAADVDTDTDAQTLSLSGNTLSISGGNSVTLPTGADNWGTQVVQTNATLSGNGTSANPLMIAQQGATNGQVLKWNGTTWAPAADADVQTLSISGTTLTISGGNSVTLPSGGSADNWGTQVVQTNATLSGNGTSANPLMIAQQGATNGQVLKWNGTTWAPATDNNTTYTAGSGISISGTTISATDASATNEIQTLSLSGMTLSLSNGGGSVTLPTGADNWGTQVAQTTARLTGNGTSASPLDIAQQGATNGQVLKWNGTTWAPAADADVQTLSISGTTLTISGGNSVTLPSGGSADNWGTQVVQTNATLSGNGTSANPLMIAQQGATNGQVLKWNGTTWAPAADNNTTYTAGSGISISGTTISATDASATNEIQTLSLSGTTLTLSNGGGSVTLPTGADNWGTQVAQTTARLTGNGTSASPLDIAQQGATNGQVLKWNGTTWAPAADNNTTYTAGSGINISGTTISATDASATNEIQTLSLSGTTLTLSNGGGSVTLPTGADNWGTQVAQTTARLTGNGTSASPLDIAQQGASNGQVLKWNGTTWAPAADNNTTYTAGSGISISGTTISATDASATNEIQTLSLSGTTLSLSNGGGSVNLTPVLNNAWNLGGNSGTNASTDFIGTLDNQPLNFRANNQKSGKIGLSGDESTFFGYQAGENDDGTVNRSTFFGYQAGRYNYNADENTAVGYKAMLGSLGSYNTAIGASAMQTNDLGNYNTAVGRQSMFSNLSGSENTALGHASLYSNTSGNHNTAIGSGALYNNTTGARNIAIGNSALLTQSFTNSNNVWFADNVAVGVEALYSNQPSSPLNEGKKNTALGNFSLRSNTTGYNNCAVGFESAYSLTTAAFNTALGAKALYSGTTGAGNTALGAEALFSNQAGAQATAVGMRAMYNANNSTTFFINYNVAIGYEALHGSSNPANNTGNSNTAVGHSALRNISNGSNNVAIGTEALRDNSTGSGNTAIGKYAMLGNLTGSKGTAVGFEAMRYTNNTNVPFDNENVAVGYQALRGSTNFLLNTGNRNTAVGFKALMENSAESDNTAMGYMALAINPGTYNSAFGSEALKNGTSSYSCAFGYKALTNDDGTDNVAVGYESLKSKTTGSSNTAVGASALASITSGDGNTAVGAGAGYQAVNTTYCTFIGTDTQPINSASYTNSTAIGNSTYFTASNQVRVGNIFVTSIGGPVGWTTVSDGRYKKDAQENVPGLDFILRLRPVTYHLDASGIARFLGEGEFSPEKLVREGGLKYTEEMLALERRARAEKEKIVYTGFIAQEVEQAARELGYDFSGVDKPQNEHSLYGLRYAEFVVPLVKAMQEQQKIIEEQRKEITDQRETIEQQTQRIARLEEAHQLTEALLRSLKAELDSFKAKALSENNR